MGRGRAKAKQQKVARDLKYNAPQTDLTALQHELAGDGGGTTGHAVTRWDDDDDVDDDRWASAR